MPAGHPFKTLVFTPEHCVFLLLVAVYMAASFFLADFYGLAGHFSPLLYMDYCVLISGGVAILYFFYLCLRGYWLLFTSRPARPAAFLLADLKQGPFNLSRYLTALPVFIGFLFFLSVFTSMKEMIPGIHPFSWDLRLIAIDRAIHFGTDPWRLLQPLLGHPYVTWALNLAYNGWMLLLFIVLYWLAFSLNNRARMQFFYTFVLSWAVNGTFLATWLSSAGPCFLERLHITGHYAPLMAYLRHANETVTIYALTDQDWLWGLSQAPSEIPGGGISAMPSIHVAVAFLYVLLAFGMGARPVWRAAAIVFYLTILVGSVHLGWHYAADGYMATATTFLLWLLSGGILRRLPQTRVKQD